MKSLFLVILIAFSLFVFSCARAPLKFSKDSMRETSLVPEFFDDMSKESFFTALRKHIDVMKTSRIVADPMTFGNKRVDKKKYIEALEKIFEHEENWQDWIRNNFLFHEVYGKDDWSEVMVTGYYEPKVRGSHEKTNEFSQALYAMPSDLITVNLKKFSGKIPQGSGERLGILHGRIENQTLVPYFDRKDIDVEKKLHDKKLELAWVDPIDAFFIQIQGSGVIEISEEEKFRVGYAAQNGHSYLPIGKFLTDVIPLEEMSMQKIRLHLETLSKDEKQKILNMNPSYVFFKKLESDALTYAGMEVSAGRTVATDVHFFPKGAMALLETEAPVFESPTDHVPTSWRKFSRLVFDQDTGGAIRGGGRVDLYFGQGDMAARDAGVMKQKGRLFYLVPKNL